MGGGFVEQDKAQVVFLSVGWGDFDKRVDLADGGNEVRDEGLELGFELNVVGFVPPDVVEQVLIFVFCF